MYTLFSKINNPKILYSLSDSWVVHQMHMNSAMPVHGSSAFLIFSVDIGTSVMSVNGSSVFSYIFCWYWQ